MTDRGGSRTSSTPSGAKVELAGDQPHGGAALVVAGVGEHEQPAALPLGEPEQSVRGGGRGLAGQPVGAARGRADLVVGVGEVGRRAAADDPDPQREVVAARQRGGQVDPHHVAARHGQAEQVGRLDRTVAAEHLDVDDGAAAVGVGELEHGAVGGAGADPGEPLVEDRLAAVGGRGGVANRLATSSGASASRPVTENQLAPAATSAGTVGAELARGPRRRPRRRRRRCPTRR